MEKDVTLLGKIAHSVSHGDDFFECSPAFSYSKLSKKRQEAVLDMPEALSYYHNTISDRNEASFPPKSGNEAFDPYSDPDCK